MGVCLKHMDGYEFSVEPKTNSACHQLFIFLGSHLREDEEQGGRADQEASGRAHRDEGAGFQRVGAAGGHPVLSCPLHTHHQRTLILTTKKKKKKRP